MGFYDFKGNTATIIAGGEIFSGDWVIEKPLELSTSETDLDRGSVSMIQMRTGNYMSLATLAKRLIGQEFIMGNWASNLYITTATLTYITPNLIRAQCGLAGICSPKVIVRTFNNTRKELTATNPTWDKKLQAEYPSFQDVAILGPGSNPSPLGLPPAPNGYSYVTDKIIIYEPYGWVVLGEDTDPFPHTPFYRVITKYQWFWEVEPAN